WRGPGAADHARAGRTALRMRSTAPAAAGTGALRAAGPDAGGGRGARVLPDRSVTRCAGAAAATALAADRPARAPHADQFDARPGCLLGGAGCHRPRLPCAAGAVDDGAGRIWPRPVRGEPFTQRRCTARLRPGGAL